VSSITVGAAVTLVDKAEAFALAVYLPKEMHKNRHLGIWYKKAVVNVMRRKF
jgi:hypothetical protein